MGIYVYTFELLIKSAHEAVGEGISEKCGSHSLPRSSLARNLSGSLNKSSMVVGVLLDHGLREALLLRTLLLRSPTVNKRDCSISLHVSFN